MEIENLIAKMATRRMVIPIFMATVTSVDKDACTCNVKTVTGETDREDVRLRAAIDNITGDVVIFPVVGSVVICGVIENQKSACFVMMCTAVDEVRFHGEGFGGLVKVEQLTAKLNALEQDLNNLKTAFTSWVPAPGDGGTALKTAAASWYASVINQTTASEIENDKVKHG